MKCKYIYCHEEAKPKQKYCSPEHAPFFHMIDTVGDKEKSIKVSRVLTKQVDKMYILRRHDQNSELRKNKVGKL